MKYSTDYFIINEYIDMKNRVRKIKFTDKAEVLKWRNDLNTRKNSLNSNAVTIEEHNNWFKKIMDGSCHISFMLEVNDIKAGFVSYEKKTNNELYTSINLNPDFRGKNLGSKFLNLTAKKLIMNGFIGTFHKDHKANTIPLCKKCHHKETINNTKRIAVKTSEGIEYHVV